MNDQDDTALTRWLQRPYVAHWQRSMGPRLTNFAALATATLVEIVVLALVTASPLPLQLAAVPPALILATTAVLWLNEPGERRHEYDAN